MRFAIKKRTKLASIDEEEAKRALFVRVLYLRQNTIVNQSGVEPV